nr:hypothetical protein [Acidobacteriota bacterium]
MIRHPFTLVARLALALITVSLFSPAIARAEDNADSAPQPGAIPSPRSVLGFTPGDDRKIADWKQISNYFAQLDRASD